MIINGTPIIRAALIIVINVNTVTGTIFRIFVPFQEIELLFIQHCELIAEELFGIGVMRQLI